MSFSGVIEHRHSAQKGRNMSSGDFDSQTPQPDDEAAVRALYKQLMDAWNKGSGEAYAAQFAEDGDLIGFDGAHFKGRQEIAPFHQRLFETYLKGTRLVRPSHERPVSESRRRSDARRRRNCDAREISAFTGARLNPDTRRQKTRQRMALRCVSKYQGTTHRS